MKIGVIQASSQIEKNSLLYRCTLDAVKQYDYEVINFGCFENESSSYSYVEIAVAISFLLTSGAVDFTVTGCSSGQGMMLACNSVPGVLCGLAVRAQDAFLFGRINDGNAISIPL
ncbi:RpiB/LacA/LacB family sugar-phosphate isomerase, partial [uncultured Dubosiella sp.]